VARVGSDENGAKAVCSNVVCIPEDFEGLLWDIPDGTISAGRGLILCRKLGCKQESGENTIQHLT
jgi:hypothetical protein